AVGLPARVNALLTAARTAGELNNLLGLDIATIVTPIINNATCNDANIDNAKAISEYVYNNIVGRELELATLWVNMRNRCNDNNKAILNGYMFDKAYAQAPNNIIGLLQPFNLTVGAELGTAEYYMDPSIPNSPRGSLLYVMLK